MTFWKSLEAISGPCAVRKYWQHHLGDVPFESVARYLRPRKGLVASYPRWNASCLEVEPYDVVEHNEDLIVIVEPESREATPITRVELVAYELHRERLIADLATAFGFRAGPVPASPLPFAWPVGMDEPLAGYAFPVYFTVSFERTRQTRIITALAEAISRPFLLLAPTAQRMQPAALEIIERRRIGFLPLCDAVLMTETGLQLTSAGELMLKQFHEIHLPGVAPARGTAFFPTPVGARWEQVQIRFLDGHSVSIHVGGVSARYEYGQLGMADQRNARPNKQWDLLRDFASNGGSMRWDEKGASRHNKKRRERLAVDLRAFFRIESEPIVLTEDRKGWRTVFKLQSDEYEVSKFDNGHIPQMAR